MKKKPVAYAEIQEIIALKKKGCTHGHIMDLYKIGTVKLAELLKANGVKVSGRILRHWHKKDIVRRIDAGEKAAIVAKDYDRTYEHILHVYREMKKGKEAPLIHTPEPEPETKKFLAKCPGCERVYIIKSDSFTGIATVIDGSLKKTLQQPNLRHWRKYCDGKTRKGCTTIFAAKYHHMQNSSNDYSPESFG